MPELLIQRLDIKGFRGVSQKKSLLFNGKSVLLFGENGTGKSTFVDALEKLFTGEVQTLDHRAQGLSSQRHGPHIKYAAEKPEIAVTLTDGTRIEASGDSSLFSTTVLKYLDISRQPIYILRRGQILAFIESQPRDRYELLRPYLTLSEVEEAEGAFVKADEQIQTDLNVGRRELSRQHDDLARQTGVTEPDEEISEVRVLEAE
jgi:DNA repair exonuclease SbcCD ATPase subunit